MNLLVITLLTPLFGAGLILAWSLVLDEADRAPVRAVALLFSVITLALAGYVVTQYPGETYAFSHDWLGGAAGGGVDVRLSVALDGLSIWLFGLSALLVFTSVLVSWEAIRERVALFYALLLLLEAGLLGVFVAQDIILFYVCFEFTLIPLFFLIGIWGSEERRYAAIKFFLFTLAGSLLTFLGLLGIVFWNLYQGSGILTFSIPELTAQLSAHPIDYDVSLGGWVIDLQMILFVALFAGFAVKVPLFPLHTWLPLAHVQAPTAGSVLLAGVLLKLGTYGFLRFSMPMLPAATAAAMPWVLTLAVAGIVYGALVALAQSDMKRLIAYSSVSHMGFCMLGIFALNRVGVRGGALQMINHGLSTGGLFAVVGMLYERYHTRQIKDLAGLATRLPWLATFMVIFTFSSIGLPGLNGFVGEFLALIGMFQRGWQQYGQTAQVMYLVIAVVAVSGVVLGAWYMLWLVKRVFFGPLREPGHTGVEVRDLSFREIVALAPLVVFIFWIGITPQVFLEPMDATLERLTVEASLAVEAPPAEIRTAENPPTHRSEGDLVRAD